LLNVNEKRVARANEAMIIVGRKRTGKSTLANKISKGLAAPYRRVLIIDVNGSPAYSAHEQIFYDKLKRWRHGGIYKFYDPDHERMWKFLTSHYGPQYSPEGRKIGDKPFHGLITFEDCTKYIDPNPSKQIKTFLVDHRMWDADLLFTFHSLSMVPPFFWKMTSRLIILKTQDTAGQLKRLEDKVPNFGEVYEAHCRVMKSEDPHAHEVVETLI
jgi:hypothetical protein